ncbi:MAG: nitrilase-related carbon-nitrogen hydrolase, partial [Candidatus Aminicenantes bacterium]
MKIALIQQHASEDIEDNLQKGVKNFKTAARSGAEVIAFAELAFLRFLPQFPSDTDAAEQAESIPGRTTQIFS